MLHLTCTQSLSMYIVKFLYLQSSLSRDGHGLSLSQQKYRLLMFKYFSQFHTLLLTVSNNLLNIGRHLLQLFSNFLYHLYRSTIFLLCYFSCKSYQVEDLMEEAFGCGYACLSSNFDVDGEVYLSG